MKGLIVDSLQLTVDSKTSIQAPDAPTTNQPTSQPANQPNMLLEFIAAIALGLGTAGLVMGLNFATGKRLPGWLMPAAAGMAMIGFMVYMEYSWLTRTTDQLPEGVIVTATSSESSWYRPWTYVKPLTLRLVAVDTRRNRTNASQPGMVMTTVILMGRWMPPREIPVVFDCAAAQRADLHASVQVGDDGSLIDAGWRQLDRADPALQAACR